VGCWGPAWDYLGDAHLNYCSVIGLREVIHEGVLLLLNCGEKVLGRWETDPSYPRDVKVNEMQAMHAFAALESRMESSLVRY
jgi:hypothetical protein